VLARDAKSVGIRPIKFHDLRATYASLYVAKGGNIYEVSKILGHQNVSMTQKYARFAPEYRERMADVLSFDVTEPAKVIPITQKSHTAS
jgi:integrase